MYIKIELHSSLAAADVPNLAAWSRSRARETFSSQAALHPEVAMVARRLPPQGLLFAEYGLVTISPLLDEQEEFSSDLRAEFFAAVRILVERAQAVSLTVSVECWIVLDPEPGIERVEDHPRAEEQVIVSLETLAESPCVWTAAILRSGPDPKLGDFIQQPEPTCSGRLFGLLEAN